MGKNSGKSKKLKRKKRWRRMEGEREDGGVKERVK